MSVQNAWTREQWANAQVNSRCSELERDLAGVMKDETLSRFQQSVLSHVAIQAAATDLADFDWFRGVA